jgi:hypothetical protein
MEDNRFLPMESVKMKWTKFIDKVPRDCMIYVTNWSSVWTAFEYQWTTFAKENPNYAWAKIPIPPTPIDLESLHNCTDANNPRGFCIGTVEGKLLYTWKDEHQEVNFCPFCGYEAKYKNFDRL